MIIYRAPEVLITVTTFILLAFLGAAKLVQTLALA